MDTVQLVQVSPGLSDTVLLSIVAGIVGIATMVIKSIIESQAEKAKAAAIAEAEKVKILAAAEAAKVTTKLQEVELKIDGRLTELLRITKAEAEERGQRLGKEQQKSEDGGKAHEVQTVQLPPATKLKIIEGEIKVTPTPEPKKKPL